MISAAIHDGHDLRQEVAELTNLTAQERLREEDPFTAVWTEVANTRIIGTQSRFEVDLNRPPSRAVYINPEDAWGLQLWKESLSESIIQESLVNYHDFYSSLKEVFLRKEQKHGLFVVFDLHTYNHRREGANGPVADAMLNPEVNIGTGTMTRSRWAPIIDRFITDLKAFDFAGRSLDVRENIKFQGGHFSKWIHQTFPETGCAIAIEFKKFFMDEWSGEAESAQVDLIKLALKSTIPGVLAGLNNMKR